MALLEPRQVLQAAHRHLRRSRPAHHQKALCAELGEAHQKVYHADPLVCRRCGGPLKIVAYITDEVSIRRILDHLGLSPPQQQRPPPSAELLRVPVDEEGRQIQAG